MALLHKLDVMSFVCGIGHHFRAQNLLETCKDKRGGVFRMKKRN
jgi:hypothetical protein